MKLVSPQFGFILSAIGGLILLISYSTIFSILSAQINSALKGITIPSSAEWLLGSQSVDI